MKVFFLLIEFAIPILAVYWVVQKQSLAIVYVPFVMFSYHIIDEKLPAFFRHFILVLLLLYFVIYNLPFLTKNIVSFIIFFYFLVLLKDYPFEFKVIRGYIINVSWLFLGIGLIPYIFKKYTREKVFSELSFSALITMGIFSINTILSTLLKYNPIEAYGINTGVLFGKISNDYYNIFPLALYLILRRAVRDKNILFFAVYFVSIIFVMLTMRRSVMFLSVIATFVVMVELLDYKNIKQFLVFGLIMSLVFIIVVSKTSFVDQLVERYEMRNLENRTLEKESRFKEFELIYKDLFVYYDYSPWFGFGLDQSHNNFGKNVFGYMSLHTDATNITHSAGLLGLFLYLLLVGIAFFSVLKKTHTKSDKIQFLFIGLCFLIYFINGRYTTVNAMLMMFGILNLPMAKRVLPKQESSLNENKEALPVH